MIKKIKELFDSMFWFVFRPIHNLILKIVLMYLKSKPGEKAFKSALRIFWQDLTYFNPSSMTDMNYNQAYEIFIKKIQEQYWI